MSMEEEKLKKENEELRQKLQETEETLYAIQKGEVDAIVVKTPRGDQLYSIVSPEHPYQLFIDNMGEGALILSTEGNILYANPWFYQMLGYSEEDVIGSLLINYIKETDRPLFLRSLEGVRQKKAEISLLAKDQKTIIASMSASKNLSKDSERICVLFTDITKLKKAQRIIQTSENVTKILSEAPNLSTALKQIVEALQIDLGWEVIVFWEWDKEKQVFSFGGAANTSEIQVQEFIESCQKIVSNKSLVSRHVWSSYRPCWAEDISEDANFSRQKAAAQNNLRGALAFPFYKESQIGGVIELFRRAPFTEEVDEQLLNLVTSIGIQIGHFIERKLAESTKAQFSTIVLYSANGIYSADVNGIVQSWNPSAEKIYGWKAEEIVGKSILQIYPKGKQHEFDEIWRDLLSGKPVQHYQTQRIKKDGSLVWVENAYGPILDSFGKTNGYCAITQDISSEKSLLKTAARTQVKLQTLLEISEEWVWEIDPTGNLTFSNPFIFNMLGYSAEELTGKSFTQLLLSGEREAFEKQLRENALQKRGWLHLPLRFQHRNGIEVWTSCNAVGVLDDEDQLIGFQGICQDISEIKKLEKAKNEFISIVSHELRTPLSSVLGALSLLKPKLPTTAEVEQLMELALRNSEKLAALINNILDAEKLQAGKIEYNFQKISIQQVVLESISLAEPIAQKLGIKIEKTPPFADAEVQGDKARLAQVMANLLSNAIKFSPKEGLVHISIEDKGKTVLISVRDHGVGISKEFESKIFLRFSQDDSTVRRPFQGIGLGLSICKGIIEDHKGTLSYKSTPGEGTMFFFEIPKLVQG